MQKLSPATGGSGAAGVSVECGGEGRRGELVCSHGLRKIPQAGINSGSKTPTQAWPLRMVVFFSGCGPCAGGGCVLSLDGPLMANGRCRVR